MKSKQRIYLIISFLIIILIFSYFIPTQKTILKCIMKEDSLIDKYLVLTLNNEDKSVIYKKHNLIRDQGEYYLLYEYDNFIVSRNIFGKALSIYHYGDHEKYTDIYEDDFSISAYDDFSTSGEDIYKGLLERTITVTIYKEDLVTQIKTSELNGVGSSIQISHDCDVVNNMI